jgi:hypothetical protein
MKLVFCSFLCLLWVYPCAAVITTLDADGFSQGADISTAFSGITLSSTGGFAGLDGKVYAYGDGLASTGSMVFGNNLSFQRQWFADLTNGFAFRADFSKLADSVSLDIIGDDYSGKDIGVLSAYNSSGVLLDTIVTTGLGYGQIFDAQINRPAYDIAYIIAGGSSQSEDTVHLDNLRVNITPEPATLLMLALGGLAVIRKHRV